MERDEAKAAVSARSGWDAEEYRAWSVNGGVWLVEERDPSMRPSNDQQVWAVLPTGEVVRTTLGLQADVSGAAVEGNQAAEAGLASSKNVSDRLEGIFPELAQSSLDLHSPVVDAVAVTPKDKSALRRIRRYSGGNSVASLMALTLSDLLGWPGVGNQNVQDILFFLDRLRRSPDAINIDSLPSSEGPSRKTRVRPHAPPASRRRAESFDPFDGQLGEVYPSLRFLTDVDLRSPWLDECARATGHSRALTYLRNRNADGVTIGDLLVLDIEEIAAFPDTSPMQRAILHDFLAQLAAKAYETREAAIETVSSWIASTSGRATWSNIVTLSFNKKPPEVQRAWKTLASMPISDRPVPHAASVITDFIAELDGLDKTILLERVIAQLPRTTDDIGREFAISARAVRDREIALEQFIRGELANAPSWRLVEWACQAYREHAASKSFDDLASDTSGSDVATTRSDVATTRRFIAWLCRYESPAPGG